MPPLATVVADEVSKSLLLQATGCRAARAWRWRRGDALEMLPIYTSQAGSDGS
jgi:hypothetical protein